MKLQSRFLSCFAVAMSVAIRLRAAPSVVPTNAIGEDTFLVATINLAKVDPAVAQATAKAAFGEKAGDMDDLLAGFKTYHEKYATTGAETVTVVMSGDPDKQSERQPIFYIRFKPDSDHAAVEKQIREEG